jgi:hypothetical protein
MESISGEGMPRRLPAVFIAVKELFIIFIFQKDKNYLHQTETKATQPCNFAYLHCCSFGLMKGGFLGCIRFRGWIGFSELVVGAQGLPALAVVEGQAQELVGAFQVV